MAKVGATEMAGRVVDRSVQVMGRFGLVRGSKIERLYREARPMRIYEGSTEVILDSLAKKLVQGPSAMIVDCHMHVWPDHIAAGHAGAASGRDAAAVRRHAVRAAPDHGRGGHRQGARPRRRDQGVDRRPHQRVHRRRCRATGSSPWAPSTPSCRVDENVTSSAGQRDRRGQAAPAVPEPVPRRPAGPRHPRGAGARRVCRSSPTSAPARTRRRTSAARRSCCGSSPTRCPTSR